MIHGRKFLSKLLVDINELTKGTEIVIRKGSYGKVIKGVFPKKRDKPEIPCAIKILNAESSEFENIFFREIGCQCSLEHEAVLPLLGCSIPIMSKGNYAIVTEFMKEGSLGDLVEKVSKGQGPKNWETIRSINIFGIAAGLAFAHQNKVIHRDVKVDNIMLSDKFHPKIADFGLSKFLEETNDIFNMTKGVGTPLYMAPELLNGEDYTNKVDVYAYGMILYELLTLRKPWSDKDKKKFNLKKFFENGDRPTIYENEMSDKFKDLIERCWDSDPKVRPKFRHIVNQLDEEKEEFFFNDCPLLNQEEFEDYIELVKKDLILKKKSEDSS